MTVVTKKKKTLKKWKAKEVEIISHAIPDVEYEKLLLEVIKLVSDSLIEDKEEYDE